MKKIFVILGIFFLSALIFFFIGPRMSLNEKLGFQEVKADIETVEKYITQQEDQISDLLKSDRKNIVWAGLPKKKTEYSLIYIHGYTGVPKEASPIPEQVAKEMGMNLYEARFKGSGQNDYRESFKGVSVQDHLRDAYEALSIGKILGKKVVIMGTSNGGPFATWLAARFPESIAALVLFSPNYHPRDIRTDLALGPWGRQIAYLVTGGYIGSDLVDNQWGSSKKEKKVTSSKIEEKVKQAIERKSEVSHYDSLMALMGIVGIVKTLDPSTFSMPYLSFYSKEDQIVSPEALEKFFNLYGTQTKATKQIVEVKGAIGTQHGGKMLGESGKSMTPFSIDMTIDFLKKYLKEKKEDIKSQKIIHKSIDLTI